MCQTPVLSFTIVVFYQDLRFLGLLTTGEQMIQAPHPLTSTGRTYARPVPQGPRTLELASAFCHLLARLRGLLACLRGLLPCAPHLSHGILVAWADELMV